MYLRPNPILLKVQKAKVPWTEPNFYIRILFSACFKHKHYYNHTPSQLQKTVPQVLAHKLLFSHAKDYLVIKLKVVDTSKIDLISKS